MNQRERLETREIKLQNLDLTSQHISKREIKDKRNMIQKRFGRKR
jgi:hypothetical protein